MLGAHFSSRMNRWPRRYLDAPRAAHESARRYAERAARLVEALAPAALAGGGRIAVADRPTAVGILAGGDLGPGRNCRAGTRQRRRCRYSGRGPGGGYRPRRSGRDRKSAGQGNRGSVRVDLGGGRVSKKTKK